ncbi:MAG: hypothetical protein IKY43_00875 [Bacteroidales bacterium]|nr:hypothetical protein [Bacteroidales bacterium]
MKKKLLLLVCLFVVLTSNARGNQEGKHGSPIISIFTNYHTGIGVDRERGGFELERSYLGYQYQLGKGLSVKAVMDVGTPKATKGDYDRLAYIKYAQITWKKDNFTLQSGLIPTLLFGVQEKFWNHRYVMQSFMGRCKFGSSADLGLSASYRFVDWFSMDAILVNGEGYKKIQSSDGGMLYGLGLTLTPIDGFLLRFYSELNQTESTNVFNYAMFMGYKNEYFLLGAEYDMQRLDDEGLVKSGLSVYGSVDFSNKVEGFLRMDKLDSEESEDGETVFVLGSQFVLTENIKIAPNIRMFVQNSDVESIAKYMVFINCSFVL